MTTKRHALPDPDVLEPPVHSRQSFAHAINFWQSLGFAWQGIRHVAATERNFRIDLVIAIGVILLGFFLGVQPLEWVALVLCMGMVFVCEALNTAIEVVVDWLGNGEYHLMAAKVKDIAAGACLMAAITTAIVGSVIFVPYLLRLVGW